MSVTSPKSKNLFAYSLSNSKMITHEGYPDVMSFSVMPIQTCAKGVPCVGKCYAVRGNKWKKQERDCWQSNTDKLMAGQWDELVNDTIYMISIYRVPFFRWNVGGDIWDVKYLKAMCDVAKACPTTKFWTFTKQYDVVKSYKEELPNNLNIVLSVWDKYRPDEDMMSEYGICYVLDKKGTFDVPKTDIYECQGGCDECQKCMTLKHGQRVFINEH